MEYQMSGQPSTSSAKAPAKRKKTRKTAKDNDCKLKAEAGEAETPRPTRQKVPAPPLPAHLPPVNLIHRDVLRAWCQEVKLSSKGQKLDAYKRLLARAFPDQMPDLKNVPDTPKEARVKTIRKKMKTEEVEVPGPQMAVPLEVVPVPVAQEQVPALTEPPVLYEEVSTTVVTTAASEAVLASWARIAANAKNEAVPSTAASETYGFVCVKVLDPLKLEVQAVMSCHVAEVNLSLEYFEKNFCMEDLDEENVILTLVPVTEEPTIEVSTESIFSSPVGLKPPDPPRPTSEAGIPPVSQRAPCLPAVLPPINDVSRNTLREWCRYHNLSTDGKIGLTGFFRVIVLAVLELSL
ncbi:hypothetical protein STEG23_002088 [Scotinomys teguina]